MEILESVGEKYLFFSFSEKIGEIIDEFNCRFADFDLLKAKVKLFSNPMEIDVESQPSHIQLKFCEMQANSFLLSKINVVGPFRSLQATSSFPLKRLP